MKTDDCDILLSLATVLSNLGKVVAEQVPFTSPDQISSVLARSKRFYQFAERQYKVSPPPTTRSQSVVVLLDNQTKISIQEALRLDRSRGDLLAAYAVFLSNFPERSAEARKYFERALRANPHDQSLQARFKSHMDAQSLPPPPPPLRGRTLSLSEPVLKKKASPFYRSLNSFRKSLLATTTPRETLTISAPTPTAKKLCVTLISAKKLALPDLSSSNLFCQLTLGNQALKSAMKKRTTSPEWNETFTLYVCPINVS